MSSFEPSVLDGEDILIPFADRDDESGYASASSSEASIPDILFTKPHLAFLNRQLQNLKPQGRQYMLTLKKAKLIEISEVLRWAITTIPSLYQTSALGNSGLVTLDMLSKMDIPRPQMVDLIFLDTLHHFPQTLALLDRIQERYPLTNVHVYKPLGVRTDNEFAQLHGERLWETDDDLYDYLAKVEPATRAYRELRVNAVLTGRRRSQGGKRGDLDIIEIDEAGLLKINPLANWTFEEVQAYIRDNNVPYNELQDRGYKSVGDWHSTQPVREGDNEREGRWKGRAKTECGIHNPRSKYAQIMLEQKMKQREGAIQRATTWSSKDTQIA